MSTTASAGFAALLLPSPSSRIHEVIDAFALAPTEVMQMVSEFAVASRNGAAVRDATYAAILLLVGGGFEWLYWGYAAALLKAVGAMRARSPRHAASLAGARLGLLWGGTLLFVGGTSLAAVSLPWPPRVGAVAGAITLVIGAARLAGNLGDTLASPLHPTPHLLLRGADHKGTVVALAAWLGGLAAATTLLPVLIEPFAPHLALATRVALAAVILTTILSLLARARPVRTKAGNNPRLPVDAMAGGIVSAVFVAWVIGAGGIAAVLADVGLAAAATVVSRRVVMLLWQEDPDRTNGVGIAPHLALSAVRFVVVSTAIAFAALVMVEAWGWSASGEAGRLAMRAFGVAILAFLTHAAWLAMRSMVDGRLRGLAVDDGHDAPGPSGRLLTLLPLLRTTAAVTLIASFVMSALWMLDIPIAPLLAGAGVFGLALGFGAQALVRDVISGIFFLVEDVFRIGEYIESGSSTKGTVERITLRTVALRHQNGPLHFVPYGSLGTVRNTSRDWVIDKFDLPLPITADSEKVRKLVKQIGIAMKDDSDIGPSFLEPLKAKLKRIEPGVKIFRCKFQTSPGRQFELRAEAYRRIEVALAEAGIGFADTSQIVMYREPVADCGSIQRGL